MAAVLEKVDRWWAERVPPVSIVLGGVLMAALFVPFTLAHGPTSFNEEREILGWDMHGWGFLLGVLPNVLIAGGIAQRSPRLAHGRRGAYVAATICYLALLLDATMNLAFRALGPPFVLFVLAPALSALAILMPGRTRTRTVVAALGIVMAVGLALALIPQEFMDSVGGYRIFGAVAYGLGGLLWALLGLSVRS